MMASAYAYPDDPTSEQMEEFARYFNGAKHVLPCPKCRKHYAEMIELHPVEPHLGSGEALRKWIVARKNDVNERLGKPCPTTDHICRTWEQKLFIKKYRKKERLAWCIALILSTVVVGGLFFYLGYTMNPKRQQPRQASSSSSSRSRSGRSERDAGGSRNSGRDARRKPSRNYTSPSPPLSLDSSSV